MILKGPYLLGASFVKAPSCLKVRLARLVLRRVLIEEEVFERYQRLLEEMTLEGHKGE